MKLKRGQVTEIAKKAGVSQATISRIFNGHRKPSFLLARKLQRILGKDIFKVIK